MKESSNGSGITIVELVIFLATVVILIGALLPDRGTAGAESALSADKSIIDEMNTALSSAAPTPCTLDEAIKVLEDSGFGSGSLAPRSEDCVYVWGKSEGIILLVRMSEGGNSIIYPEKYVGVQYDPDGYFVIADEAKSLT